MQVALPACSSSVAGAQPLISELLPGRLQHVAGTYDPLYMGAISEWCTLVDSATVQLP